MAGVPQNFQSISNVIASYDFVDIASGTGYITLYAGTTCDLKVLSNFIFASNTVADDASTAGATVGYELMIDHDYDLLLNRPLDIKGLGVVNVPIRAGNISNDYYCIVILRKWDGVTETDIVTNTGSTISAGADNVYFMNSIDLNCPLTHYKKGEYLRLTIRLYGNSSAGAANVQYGHDPESRTYDVLSGITWAGGADCPTQLKLLLPVRLNL